MRLRRVKLESNINKKIFFYLRVTLLILSMVLMPNSYLSADDNTINGSCPGEIIEEINDTNVSASHTESGWIGSGGFDIYQVTFKASGYLKIDALNKNSNANENYNFYISKNSCGVEDSDWNVVSAEYGNEHHHTVDIQKGDKIYIKLGSIKTEPNKGKHNYNLSLTFNTLEDEDIPDEYKSSIIPVCGVFTNMFQTREKCNGDVGGDVTFNSAGQTLDGSKNIILNAVDVNLSTCSLRVSDDIENNFETCGDKGDCIATGNSGRKIRVFYDNPPKPTSLIEEPFSDTSKSTVTVTNDVILTESGYNIITTDSTNNLNITFNIKDALTNLKINSLKLSNNNVVEFKSDKTYSLEIGEIDIENGGENNTIVTDEQAKNIKIKNINLSGGTKLNLNSSQTIQIENLEVGKGNSDISLVSQYVEIDRFILTNVDGEDAKIHIKADYIDIGELNFGEGATLIVEPFTPGNRVLFRSNFIKAVSNSTMKLSSGDYFTKKLEIPGAPDSPTLIASDENQVVNFFIDGDFKPEDNAGINSVGNNGQFGNNPPSNFMLFINGDFETTDGDGSTLNGLIYVEKGVDLGSPTYIKGAVSAKSYISVGDGQFTYDKTIYDSHWGPCSGCVEVEWEKELYTVFEDYQKPIPPKKSVNTVLRLPDGPVGHDIIVHYKTIEGTAIEGQDYPPLESNATVVIKAGESNVTVPIEIYNDAPIELDENFFVQLYNPLPKGRVCLNEHNKTQILIKAQTDVPICFEDDFSKPLDDKWRVLKSSGGFTPQIVEVNGDRRLRLTPSERFKATAITKDYEFNTRENLIIVEIDYYAYGGCGPSHLGRFEGADGMVNVLFDSKVGDSPQPGAHGGSMGYAQMFKKPGFEGGWLGLGIDEFGNFGNCNEGRVGGLKNTSCDEGISFPRVEHRNTAVIRGDLNNGDRLQGYEFLAGVEVTKEPFLQPTVAKRNKYGPDGYFSGRYKMTVDARDPNHLYIKLERKISLDGDFQTIIEEFDAKDPKYGQGETPESVRYAITAGTGAGCNNHEISWIKLRGNCQAYNEEKEYIKGVFTAIDDFRWDFYKNSLKDGKDRAISTKNVKDKFQILIASLDEDGITGKKKKDIDVKYALFSKKISIDTVSKIDFLSDIKTFDATNDTYQLDEFSTDKSFSDAFIRIFYCAERNATNNEVYVYPLKDCGVVDNDKEKLLKNSVPEGTNGEGKILYYYESDHFAIKPSSFAIEGVHNGSSNKAGKKLNITFKALNKVNAPTINFIEESGKSFEVEINDSKLSNGCIVGKFTPPLSSKWAFEDGIKVVETKYPEVGKIYIRISDTDLSCQRRFASIDCNDKNITGKWNTDTDTAIGEAKVKDIRFFPDHFDINRTLKDYHISSDNATDMNFTYISKDLNMSSSLSLGISAKNGDGNLTKNYNKECYAKDLSLDIGYLINSKIAQGANGNNPNPEGIDKILFELKDDKNLKKVASNVLSPKISISSISADIFNTDHNGSAKLQLKINFNRKMNNPVQPFFMNIKDINATDADNTGSKMVDENLDNNATFLYAKVKPSQKIYDYISENSVETPISILVYSLPSGDVKLEKTLFTLTNEYNWFLNTIHNPVNDGLVKLSIGNGVDATVTNPNINKGSDNNVKVTAKTSQRPLEVHINLTGTDSWLIFNPDKDSEPQPFYKVRFIGGGGWTGYGKTGNVVDTDNNYQKSKRLEW